MGIFTSLIAGVFVYIGGMFLFSNVVVGTSDFLNIARNVTPVVCACVTAGLMWKFFR